MIEMEEIKFIDMPTRCPESLKISWIKIPPYIYNASDGRMHGVFRGILTDMVNFCCNGDTSINFTTEAKSISNFEDMLQNGTEDIFLPVYGNDKKKYILGNPFISLVESPGIAFFYGQASSSRHAIIDSFLTAWPVLAVVIVFALVIGAGFWLLEIMQDSWAEQDSRSLQKRERILDKMEGPWKGFYWALVTLTTVGYGDFCPKSITGRILAIIWILFGTVILSMFTASITTGLLTACLSNQVSLAGSRVAVLSNSKESKVATVKNAISFGYPKIEDLPAVLSRGDTDGILLDSYVAGHYQNLFEKFLLAEVIEYIFTYGIVLRNKGLWMEQCLRLYPQVYKNDLFRTISSTIIPFKPKKFGNQAAEKSAGLIDFRSSAMQTFLIGLVSFLGLLILAGFIRERFSLKKGNKGTNFSNRKQLSDGEARMRMQQRKHINETCTAFKEIQNELESLHASLTKMIEYGKGIERFEVDTSPFENGNNGNHSNELTHSF